MNKFLRACACVLSLVVSSASQADVVYTFSGFYSNANHAAQADYTGFFELHLPAVVTADLFVPNAAAVSCHAGDRLCFGINFYMNAAEHGFSVDSVPLVTISDLDPLTNASITTNFYYFAAGAFSTLGAHASLYGFNPATLSVSQVPGASVPEPGSAYLLIGAMLLLAFARARHRD